MGMFVLYTLFFNIFTTLALTYLDRKLRAISSSYYHFYQCKFVQYLRSLRFLSWHATAIKKPKAITEDEVEDSEKSSESNAKESKSKGMILPFEPLTMTFHNVNYYVDMPQVTEFV